MRGFLFALARAAQSRSRAELHPAQRRWSSDLAQRFSHSAEAPARPSFGIAFDIDGVILRGRSPIGGSTRAIRRLYSEDGNPRIPFLFLTNGGGVPEHRRALELSKLLGVNISPPQVMHGHSPYRELVNRLLILLKMPSTIFWRRNVYGENTISSLPSTFMASLSFGVLDNLYNP